MLITYLNIFFIKLGDNFMQILHTNMNLAFYSFKIEIIKFFEAEYFSRDDPPCNLHGDSTRDNNFLISTNFSDCQYEGQGHS